MSLITFNPYAKDPAWKEISQKDKPDYISIKYQAAPEFKQGLRWRLACLARAFFASFTMIIRCGQDKKRVFTLLKSCWTGLDFVKVHLAKEKPVFGHANELLDPAHPPAFQQVDAQEVYRLQHHIQVTNPKYPALNLLKLDPELLPRHKMVLGDVTYYFSVPFNYYGRKMCCIALVQIGDKVFPRLVYRSDSQATWRVMPAAEKDEGVIGRFGKGLAETDTNLSIALNLALQNLIPLFTMRNYSEASNIIRTAPDYTAHYLESVSVRDFCTLRPGAPDHFVKSWKIIHCTPDPTAIILPENQKPDFSECIGSLTFKDSEYKSITAKVFPSVDKQMQYLFYEVEDKVFLAGIEKVKDNPINSYGLRKEAVETQGMDAPLIEYKEQVPVECEGEDYKKAGGIPPSWIKYISNWNYVRQLKIIEMYYAAQGKPVPGKV